MLVTYLRSSSVGNFQMCPYDFYMGYVLGIEKPSGKSALLGNAAHKSLEVLARRKLAEQNGEPTFSDPETGREFSIAEATPAESLEYGWSVYTDPAKTLHRFGLADRRSLEAQVEGVLRSPFNPLLLDVVCPEQYFDFEIDAEWAKYSWVDPHDGEIVEGQLALRGTMDLVFRTRTGVLGYCDWKTGTRINWKNRSPKLYEHFYDDYQLLSYYLAMRRLYPTEKLVEMTIYWTRDGGPFSLFYTDGYEVKALARVREAFEAIRDTDVPSRIKDDMTVPDRTKPCGFCHFAKVGLDGSKGSACDEVHQQVQQLGLERVTETLGVPRKWRNYGSGGGVSDRDARTKDE